VKLLLNLIWLIFGGLLMALGYAVVAIVMFILIITIPFGIASARIALFCLWPFGRTLVRRPDAGTGSVIGNIIWFVLAGWWLALGHVVTGVLMCITIIGIPLGLANFKLIPVSLTPFGRDIVDLDQGRRLGYAAAVSVPADPARGHG
jgi:uncharacterized membrane protein YccF (DUF307 family)